MNENQELHNLEQLIISKVGKPNLDKYNDFFICSFLQAERRKMIRDEKRWFSANSEADEILAEASRIVERKMRERFPEKSHEQIMNDAVKVAKNRRRYKPPLTIRKIAERFHITEISLRRRLYQ